MSNESVEVTLARMEERLESLSKDVREINDEVKDLRAQAHRWKGAFWVMVAFGGLIGWLVNLLAGFKQ